MKGGRNLDEMTAPEINTFLETLADLVEAKAKTVEEAVAIIRSKLIKV